MSYTHYWSFNKRAADVKTSERRYQLALKKIQQVATRYNQQFKSGDYRRLSGYTAYSAVYGGVNINGSKEEAHEDFRLREHFNENRRDFCKTASKPYDIVVVASLILLKHYLKESFDVNSDGDAADWEAGLTLAKELTGLKSLEIPKTIEGSCL